MKNRSILRIVLAGGVCAAFRPMPMRRIHSFTQLANILDDRQSGGDSADSVDFDSFNPLKYNAANSPKNLYNEKASLSQISLRKVTMQEMTGRLLNVVGDEAATQSVLGEYKDFLLEPLEDQDAVLEADSIYRPHMNRAERYQTYRESMDERIANSKNPQVQSILQSMRDFVLSFANGS